VTAVADLVLLLGLFFIAAGVVGVLRLPDFYSRLHALGKSDTLGVALSVGALALRGGFTLTSAKILLIVVFVVLANPTATHALGRAAYRAGIAPWRRQASP
jgi:multicomponent Na+:H+ antiporter subunit G